MKNLKKRTETGIKWSLIDQVSRLVVTIFLSVFLARLIPPADFGLYAMVTVFVGFLNVFRDFGLGAALVQRKNLSKPQIDSIFWISIFIGIVLGITIFLSASLVVQFYEEPQLLNITRVMGLIFFIGSVGLVPDALIKKAMDFKLFFFRNISNNIVSGSIAIIFAFQGYGVWALVIQSILYNCLGVLIGFRMVKWKPSFYYSWKTASPFMRFSLPLLGENSINYWVRNIDNLIIGKFLGQQTLGFYSKAYSLMLLPVRQISGSITRVIFPSFSIAQDNKMKVWENYIKLLKITSFITFPLMAFLFIIGDELIDLLYGPDWAKSAPIFKALCFLGAAQSLAVYCGSIFSSQGKTLLQLKLGLFLKPLMILGIIGGLFIGDIMGLIIGYTLTSTLAFFVESFYVAKILDKHLVFILKALYKEGLAALITLLLIFWALQSLNLQSNIIKIILSGISGSVIYLIVSYILRLEGLFFLKHKLNGFKKNN